MRRALRPCLVLLMLAIFPLSGCGKAIVRGLLVPKRSVLPADAPPAPDYSDPAAWAALPDRTDKADLVPEGVTPGDQQATAQADTFFIHPTTYYRSRRWNGPIDDVRANQFTDEDVMTGQASAFNACCRVYAPRYRQATLGTYMTRPEDERAIQTFGIAYSDVARAFAYYLEHYNQGRPFIIASHSQGSMHAMRLLEELDRSPARKLLVAAYIGGYRLPEEKFGGSFHTIEPCRSATDTGCVVAWDTYAEGGAPADAVARRYWYGDQLKTAGSPAIHCTNPLSWSLDGKPAAADLNVGAVLPPEDRHTPGPLRLIYGDKPLELSTEKLAAPIARYSSAQCRDGLLMIPRPAEKRIRKLDLGGGNFHVLDYAFFYMNIRQNAIDRVAAFEGARLVAGQGGTE